MKIQATKIEAGQTIKVAKIFYNKEAAKSHQELLETCEKGSDTYNRYNASLTEIQTDLNNGVDGEISTDGKHTVEINVLEVKKYVKYIGVNEGSRTTGWNETLLVTDKGSYLVPNRNKVTLVD